MNPWQNFVSQKRAGFRWRQNWPTILPPSSHPRPIECVQSKSRLADDPRFPYRLVTLSRSLKVGTTIEITGKPHTLKCRKPGEKARSYGPRNLLRSRVHPASAILFPAPAGSLPIERPTRSAPDPFSPPLRRRLASVARLRRCSTRHHHLLPTRLALRLNRANRRPRGRTEVVSETIVITGCLTCVAFAVPPLEVFLRRQSEPVTRRRKQPGNYFAGRIENEWLARRAFFECRVRPYPDLRKKPRRGGRPPILRSTAHPPASLETNLRLCMPRE
jgi:hypothetical protein